MWIASWTSCAVGDVERAADLLRPRADVLVDLQPAAARAQRGLDRLGPRRRRAHEQRRVERVGLERRPGRGEPLGRVGAEVPDRAEVLDHERRQPAGERGVGDLRREPVHVRVDAAGRDDHAGRVDHGRARVEHDVDAVHRVRVAGAADRDDAPVAHAEARATHAEHRVGDQPADDRELDAAALGAHAEPVAHRVAEAGQDPVGPARLVGLGHEPEVGVGEPDGPAQAPRYPRSRAQRRAPPRSRPSASSGPSARPAWPRITRAPPNGSEQDLARDARVEEDLRAGRDREPHAPGRGAVEAQRAVDLEEVEVRRDADRDARPR